MQYKKKLVDPGTGVYEGDLRYGRRKGDVVVKTEDFAAKRENGQPTNKPVCGLALVEKRNPELWKKPVHKIPTDVYNDAKFQMMVLEFYQHSLHRMKANIHITIDKSRL
jgi:hypothetical protein